MCQQDIKKESAQCGERKKQGRESRRKKPTEKPLCHGRELNPPALSPETKALTTSHWHPYHEEFDEEYCEDYKVI